MTEHDSLPIQESLLLIGSEEVEIQILKGGQQIEESIRKLLRENLKVALRDEAGISSMFIGARWVFYLDGKFLFTPFSTVDADINSSSITGTYLKNKDTVTFQGERQSSGSGIECVDGIIHTDDEIYRAEFIYSTDKTIAKTLQVLSQNAQPPSRKIEIIEGIEVPSTFKIVLEGKTEAQSFGSLAASLEISPHSHPNDPNPFEVWLSTETSDRVGRFFWQSFWGSLIEEGERDGTITANNGQVDIEFQPPREARGGLTWETINQGEMARYLPTVGVDVNQGTLSFGIQGDRISGSIRASGTVFGFAPEPERFSTYEAQFTGQRIHQQQEENLELAEAMPLDKSETSELQTETALGSPETDTKDEFLLPSVFNVSIEGRTEAQHFGPLTGELMISPSRNPEDPDPEDPNPFFVFLHTDIEFIHINGFIVWTTFNGDSKLKQLESRVFVEDGQIRLEVEPSERLRSLQWKTLPDATTADVAPVPVHTERGNFTFSIQGDQISGEIHASGWTLDETRKVSTYDAQITGERQFSRVAEEIRGVLSSSSFAGRWETGNCAFGQIELQENEQTISGTYTERGGGVIEGTAHGSRLDFTWKDGQAEGWGFLRAIFSQGTLTGLWGYSTDKNSLQSLTGTRLYPALLASQNLTDDDAQELRPLARELAQQERGELAIPLLEKLLSFYKSERERLKQQNKSPDTLLTEEVDVLHWLVFCEAQSHSYDRLLNHLQYAVKLKKLQDPKQSFQWEFSNRIDDIVKDFNHTIELLESIKPNIIDSELLTQEHTKIVEAFTFLIEYWERLQNRLKDCCAELNYFKTNVKSSQDNSPLANWMNLANFLEEKQTFVLSEIEENAERVKEVFKEQFDIVGNFNAWLRGFNYKNLSKGNLSEIYEIDALEERIKHLLANNSKLTKFEKQLFTDHWIFIKALTRLSCLIEMKRRKTSHFAEILEERFPFEKRLDSYYDSLAKLSDPIESLRKDFVKEIDKINVLRKGQTFLQELVKLLFELGSYKEALVVAEKTKTRAFADFLAARSDIQEGTRQIFSKEKVLLSIAQAPPLTFEDILKMVQQQ